MGFGEQFLHQKDSGLQSSKPVEHAKQQKQRIGETVSQKPAEKIADFLSVLERTHGHHDDPRVLERIKQNYHKQFVIKSTDVPESVFLLEQRIARAQGHGTIEITDEFKQEKTRQIIADQKSSLDRWVNYLASPDANYPTWAKYWAFNSMVQMGKFEKKEEEKNGQTQESARFGKRTNDTVAAFPTLNARALAETISAMKEQLEQKLLPKDKRSLENRSKKLTDAEYQKLLNSESFSKLYTQFLIEMPEYSVEGLKETRGEWVTYPKGSDPKPLVDSLEGHPLEWCTANIDTARGQLAGGDFYVYYSFDKDSKPTIPRVAIRMEDNRIGEVRGIAKYQNMDPYIGDVVKAKLGEFPDGEQYERKASHMKRLTEVEEKMNRGEGLTQNDLRFLYQIDSSIEGFGHGEDPRIEEIVSKREVKEDVAAITGFSNEEISTNINETFSEIAKIYYGNIFDLIFKTYRKGLKLTEQIGHNLFRLTPIEGLSFWKGDVNLSSLNSADGLKLPEIVAGDLNLNSLVSAKGLILPKKVGGRLSLGSLVSSEGLKLPEIIDKDLHLFDLKSADDLTLPVSIGGNLNLSSLRSVKGLGFPKHLGKSLSLGLISAQGIVLPEFVGEAVYLNHLRSAVGMIFPKVIGQSLEFPSLLSIEGLNLSETIMPSVGLPDTLFQKSEVMEKLRKENPQIHSFYEIEEA